MNGHTDFLPTVIAFVCFAVVSTATVGLMFFYCARCPDEAAENLTRLQDRVLAASPAVMALGALVVGVLMVTDGLNQLVGS